MIHCLDFKIFLLQHTNVNLQKQKMEEKWMKNYCVTFDSQYQCQYSFWDLIFTLYICALN